MKDDVKTQVKASAEEIKRLGGISALWKGDWLLGLVQRSFRNYSDRATADHFRLKYPSLSNDEIAKKLTKVACQNARWLGAITGAATSADEIAGLVTGGEGGVGLPANILIFVGAASTEAYVLVKIQVQLVANLAKIYGVPLDPDDPEDIQTILHYAFGGAAAESLGKVATKGAKKGAERAIRKYLSGETLQTVQKLFKSLGVKILQRTLIKYIAPAASVLVGASWNYYATKEVGRRALIGFCERAKHNNETEMSASCGS
jgi:uncharacterized protein (DUF697 family)